MTAASNREALRMRLAQGPFLVGEVLVRPDFSLCHREDADRADLRVGTDPHDAVAIARYDDAGRYRSLKTAPNLAHGWRLRLASPEQVLLALDFLYPAAVGTARWAEAGRLVPVPLSDTLGRQTGMYAVTRRLTPAQAEDLAQGFCRPGCLRKILWRFDQTVSPPPLDPADAEIPLLCAEACNLFVAEARKVVKAAQAKEAAGG